jgi:hypothetical protein
MAIYQNKIKLSQQTRNLKLMQTAQNELQDMRRRNNIRTADMFINLMQLPLLMTWFFSIRYVMSLPEIYPTVRTEGLLWFKDLSVYDSLFLLPGLSACFSYYNLANSPNLRGGVAIVPIMAQIQQYVR